MATDLTGGSAGYAPHSGVDKVYLIEQVIDFSVNNASATDVLEVIPVPAMTSVLQVGWEVITAEGGTATIDIGDGDDDDYWKSAADANDATVMDVSGTAHHYATADTIDITCNNDMDAAKVRIWAILCNITSQHPDYS